LGFREPPDGNPHFSLVKCGSAITRPRHITQRHITIRELGTASGQLPEARQ